ncbi:MAG TPA: hypothetical protein VLQ79_04645 [Myxococcaceae bacterium]|nr:hypothetical protein [Myxococcaceae bacterium]
MKTLQRHSAAVVTLAGLAAALLASYRPSANSAPSTPAPTFVPPAWAYALGPVPAAPPPQYDTAPQLRLAGSSVELSEAQIHDLFAAPDWFPAAHSPMPEVVARGAKPAVFACGYCHTPAGQGRPENAPLAGLPAAYIIAQMADFRSGARASGSPGPHLPTDLMIRTASAASAEQVAAAAEYFSLQTLGRRVAVVERTRVPRTRPVGWVHAVEEGGGDEPLGERLLEVAPDMRRHELRDETLVYVAYVPRGSLARGRWFARTGSARTPSCASCHGPELRGGPEAPPIAGRSPSYLLRQLLAFRTGARGGPLADRMRPVVGGLSLRDMIAAAAYAGVLPP